MLFIGGTEGSGTRLVSTFCAKAGFYIGDNVNKSKDAMSVEPFYKKWTRPYLEGKYDEDEMFAHLVSCVEEHVGENTNPLCSIKNPRSLLLLPFIHSIYPKAKFVHIVRRGLSMAFSANRRHARHYGDLFVQNPQIDSTSWSPELAIKIWNDTNLAAFKYGTEQMMENYLLVRFEDLCTKKIEVYEELAEFMGCSLDVIPAMLRKVHIPKTWKRGKNQSEEMIIGLEEIGKEAIETFGYKRKYLDQEDHKNNKIGEKMSELHDNLVKHWSENNSLMDRYWNDKDLIDGSKKLATKILSLNPESVYEIGMHNGRNLKYIHELMPDIKIGGNDVNKMALEFAANALPDKTIIDHIDALHMDTIDKFDVVFTHGVLMHISPDVIYDVIDKCLEKATKYIVHIERMEQDNKIFRGPAECNPGKIGVQLRWSPNIAGIYRKKGAEVIVNKETYFGSKKKKVSFIIVKK